MIRVCFFDLFNTLVYYHPTREERQCAACRQFGFEIDTAAMARAYVEGEHFWTLGNAQAAIQKRPREEQRRFFAQYERTLLAAAGVEVSEETALAIYRAYRETQAHLHLFDDVLTTFQRLRSSGLVLGVVSNWERELTQLCGDLGIADYLTVILSSAEVGVEKPDLRVFEEALRRAEVEPTAAIHIGDQYHSDVVGARRAGIQPVLLDRLGYLTQFEDCPRIRTLAEIPSFLGLEAQSPA